MRLRHRAFALVTIGFVLFSCQSASKLPFDQPNGLLKSQIDKRVSDLRYTHGEELMSTLDWLTRCGEAAFPALIEAMDCDDPTTRAGAANVLGRGVDRRVIPFLMKKAEDPDPRMRYEVARALLRLGEWSKIPVLIEGLRDPSEYVRALCNDALKQTTRLDFGFLPGAASEEREVQVRKWEAWSQAREKDAFFATRASAKPRAD